MNVPACRAARRTTVRAAAEAAVTRVCAAHTTPSAHDGAKRPRRNCRLAARPRETPAPSTATPPGPGPVKPSVAPEPAAGTRPCPAVPHARRNVPPHGLDLPWEETAGHALLGMRDADPTAERTVLPEAEGSAG
ncbi:hypothetical protein [Kitasatospora sp. NPDC056184]|uniref:hypothetical protein n=1 Tax=Kitasatospora sp. NPDC056184 TaxID=3345738 RepID=UPI0035D85956